VLLAFGLLGGLADACAIPFPGSAGTGVPASEQDGGTRGAHQTAVSEGMPRLAAAERHSKLLAPLKCLNYYAYTYIMCLNRDSLLFITFLDD